MRSRSSRIVWGSQSSRAIKQPSRQPSMPYRQPDEPRPSARRDERSLTRSTAGADGRRCVYASRFEYLRATSWEEAVRKLQEDPDDTRLLAGGQSLVPMMNLRLVQASRIIDLNHIANQGIRVS